MRSLTLSSGLDFTAQAIRHNVANTNSELADSFRTAYGATLKPFHNFLIKPVFSAAMGATPYRRDFYAKLDGGAGQNKVAELLEAWLSALERIVAILKAFLARPENKI